MERLFGELMKGIGNGLRILLIIINLGIVLLIVAVCILIIWLVNKHEQRKHQMDIETLGMQGEEIEAEKARIREEQLAELKKKRQKRKKILKVVTIIALAVIIVGSIVRYSNIVSVVQKWLKYENINSAEVGSKVLFGHYKNSNGWIVLDKKDDKLLLLSEYGICIKKFNEERETVTWSTCSLRKWLNTEYLTQAFSEKELERIVDTSVYTKTRLTQYNYRYEETTIPDSENTIDKVFLLSLEEAKGYFSSDEERMTTTTEGERCSWWLRTSRGNDEAGWIYYNGEVCESAHVVNNEEVSVRPAMWIKLDTK